MGWSNPDKSDEHYLMLIIGEISEAIQAHRKGNVLYSKIVPESFVSEYVDNPHVPNALFKHTFENYCKDSTADELADVMLRLLSLIWLRGYNEDVTNKETFDFCNVFTEDALRLTRLLISEIPVRERLWNALYYVVEWSESLDIDIMQSCVRKMRYNRIREDWKNKEKRY